MNLRDILPEIERVQVAIEEVGAIVVAVEIRGEAPGGLWQNIWCAWTEPTDDLEFDVTDAVGAMLSELRWIAGWPAESMPRRWYLQPTELGPRWHRERTRHPDYDILATAVRMEP